jgi:hypothetical protein
VALLMALAGGAVGQDSAAVRSTERLRDRMFGDTNSAFKRLGYRALNGLVQPVPPSTDDRWRRSLAFDVPVGGQQALGLGLGLVFSPPARPGPAPLRAELKVMGRYGVTGSSDLRLHLLAPDLVSWRSSCSWAQERMLRTPYRSTKESSRLTQRSYSILY